MSTYTLDLIRHAESTWVEEAAAAPEPLFGGRMNDVELNDRGMQQAQELGLYAVRHDLRPDAFLSSPARRALGTHWESARAMGREDEPFVDDRWQEKDWGDWERQPRRIRTESPYADQIDELGDDFPPPNGESNTMVRQRGLAAINDIPRQHRPGYYWVHTHRNLIKAVIAPFLGWTPEQTSENNLDVCSLTRLTLDDHGRLDLQFFNLPTLV